MKNTLKKPVTRLAFAALLLVRATASFADSKELLNLAMVGHDRFETNRLVESLREGDFKWEQVAQFFADRAHLLKILEARALTNTPLVTQNEEIFYRSRGYERDLKLLTGRWIETPVSRVTREYGEFLKAAPLPLVKLNLWLILVGETFGTQLMCSQIQKHLGGGGSAAGSVGFNVKSFSMPLSEARALFNQWIDEASDELLSLDVPAAIAKTYDFSFEQFDAAFSAKPVSPCTSMTKFLSRSCYRLTGF